MTLFGLIPARGGSKGIPNKNKKLFCGKPLIQWTIESALFSQELDRLIVSTDDIEIAEIAKKCGAEVPFLRPSELAIDNSPTIDTVLHFQKKFPELKSLLLLQATSPLRSKEDISGILSFQKRFSAESVASVNESSEHPSYMFYLENEYNLSSVLNQNIPPRRQDLPKVYNLNGALYFVTIDFLIKEKKLINNSTLGYIMPLERSIDIDTNNDWNLAEYIMKKNLKYHK